MPVRKHLYMLPVYKTNPSGTDMGNTPSAGTQTKPRLLDQMRDKIRFKHYGIRTEQAYPDWIRRFILFHAKKQDGCPFCPLIL